MAPTIADQVEKIAGAWNSEARNQDAWHNELPYQHLDVPELQERERTLAAEMQKTDNEYGPKLVAAMRQADSLRREILQKLSPKSRTDEDKKMEAKFRELLQRTSLRLYLPDDEVRYLRQLGERLAKEN
jgi:hypothetical protein